MASIRFVTFVLALSLASGAWGFKCKTAGKTNGVCFAANTGTGTNQGGTAGGNTGKATAATAGNKGNLSCATKTDKAFCCAQDATAITGDPAQNNDCAPAGAARRRKKAGGSRQNGRQATAQTQAAQAQAPQN